VADWQVTATTIYCDAVDDNVMIIVYKDGSIRCTGYKKYVENSAKKLRICLKRKANGWAGI
jgi:hypothetical protein